MKGVLLICKIGWIPFKNKEGEIFSWNKAGVLKLSPTFRNKEGVLNLSLTLRNKEGVLKLPPPFRNKAGVLKLFPPPRF